MLGVASNSKLSLALNNFHESANNSFTDGFDYVYSTLNVSNYCWIRTAFVIMAPCDTQELNNVAHGQLEAALSSTRSDLRGSYLSWGQNEAFVNL